MSIQKFIEIVSLKNIIIYLIIINVIGFLAMFIDKWKAKRGAWRIAEKTLFLLTLPGAGVGTIAGMYIFRHKTKKLYFTIGSSNFNHRNSLCYCLGYEGLICKIKNSCEQTNWTHNNLKNKIKSSRKIKKLYQLKKKYFQNI